MQNSVSRDSGKGLGKNEDGIAQAIAPKKKEDTAGVSSLHASHERSSPV